MTTYIIYVINFKRLENVNSNKLTHVYLQAWAHVAHKHILHLFSRYNVYFNWVTG